MGSTSTLPEIGARRRPHLNALAQRALKQIRHPRNQDIDVDNSRFQRLATRKGQQLLGKTSGTPCSARGIVQGKRDGGIRRPPAVVWALSRLPSTTVSRLLKSCAMPAVSRPTASILADMSQAFFHGLSCRDIAQAREPGGRWSQVVSTTRISASIWLAARIVDGDFGRVAGR